MQNNSMRRHFDLYFIFRYAALKRAKIWLKYFLCDCVNTGCNFLIDRNKCIAFLMRNKYTHKLVKKFDFLLWKRIIFVTFSHIMFGNNTSDGPMQSTIRAFYLKRCTYEQCYLTKLVYSFLPN